MIQVLLSLPESAYKEMCENGIDNVDYDIRQLMRDGILLPKSHGDLIDRQELLKSTLCKTFGLRSVDIENAPTIIEAEE